MLVHATVGDDQGEVEFHLSDQTIWSSRKPQVSARERTETRTIRVPSRRLDDLFREHGVPYYARSTSRAGMSSACTALKRRTSCVLHLGRERMRRG